MQDKNQKDDLREKTAEVKALVNQMLKLHIGFGVVGITFIIYQLAQISN